MAFKKVRLISKFISKGSFKLNKISKKIFKLNPILKREKPLKRHKKTKSIKKPFNKNKSFLKASVLLIGALGGLPHLRASECRYWSWWSGYHDKIESGSNSPTHNSYCLFSSAQGSGTYYLNTLTTYSPGEASFTQKFNNGTLNVGGNIRFGGTGVNGVNVGYITGTYDAQTINFNSSRITTGNSLSDGGGTTLNFNAANHITINQASFDNGDAGAQHSYMNFKGSNINVSGSSFTDDTNGGFSFSGNNNNSAISFNKTSFNQGTYKFTNSANLSFNNSAFNQGTYNFNSAQSVFENSNFNQGTYNFTDNASFNNDTFNQGTYSFNTSKVSFSGTNTLNSSSPFANLKGSVSFGSGAIFNLNQTLNANQTYDILTTNGTIQYGVYQSYLWNLINYKGNKAISHVEVGSNTYDVTFDINEQDETLQETFSNKSITTQFLGDDLQAKAKATYQQDLSNSQSALNNATSDNKIASNDTDYTNNQNATIKQDAQSLENTSQQIAKDQQALEKDLDNLQQLANSTTGFNEQAFNQAQNKEQQDEQTLQNEEKTFSNEQEGLKQAIAQAKPASPTPSPTPTPTKHTAQNNPPNKVSPPTQNLPTTNVWSGVYWLQNKTYSQKGVYYIDPNLSGQSGQSGNTLSTYTANLLGRSFGVNIQNGTLIIGNNTESVNDNGLIWIGHGGFGYIIGTFNAANIYLTNNFKTGEGVSGSDGGGANITFKASDNITMDGLNYNDAETVTKMIQTGASQHSYATFDATNNISVTDSSFSDMTWGKFSFNAKNISFSNASFSGFTNPGGSSVISANATNSLSFNNSRLNGGAVYNLQANSLIFNNTQAVFNVLYSRGTSNFNATTQLLGNTSFTLSSQSLLNFNGDTTLQNNANITLGNKSQAAFKNSLTLDNNSNLSLDNQSVLNANGASAFNNQASLNIYNGSQATFKSLFFNGGTLSLNANSKLNASSASFSNNTTINLDDSVLSASNASSLNANINFQGASQADFGGNTTIDTASFNFDSASSLSFNNLTANGALNFNGYAPSLTKALMSVSGQFVLGNNGDINLSDINIFDNITKSVTYNILNAQKGITGISGG